MGIQTQPQPERNAAKAVDVSIPEWTRQVRDVLKGSGPMSLASLARKITDASTNEVAMAVGWLAHAGEIRFREREGVWEVDLK